MTYRECSGDGSNAEDLDAVLGFKALDRRVVGAALQEIGRASCRERGKISGVDVTITIKVEDVN